MLARCKKFLTHDRLHTTSKVATTTPGCDENSEFENEGSVVWLQVVQMVKRILAAVAVAASQFSIAAACGWPGEACCNIQPNDPNVGDCVEERNVCWEGTCMDCGTNGKIKCPSTLPFRRLFSNRIRTRIAPSKCYSNTQVHLYSHCCSCARKRSSLLRMYC